MKYNFDNLAKRKNTDSLKWDYKKCDLPMWVADMDFKAPSFIVAALKKRVNIEAYGYSLIPEEYYQSIINWWVNRHNLEIKRDWLVYVSGVVASISSMVRLLTDVGDNVITLSPVYNIFYSSILNNKRQLIECSLKYENNSYSIDYDDLENKMKLEKSKLLIFCNPHNPIGHIWDKQDLEIIGKLAKKYNVFVISDEIHCDFVDPGFNYNPFISIEENKNISITCISPSKTFNIAGLQSACMIIPNEELRRRVEREINNNEVAEPNFFSMAANIAAYNHGAEWVDELREYIYNNKQYVYNFIAKEIPHLQVIKGNALYLMWIDISHYSSDSVAFTDDLLEKTGLFVNEGQQYKGNGSHFIRLNVATSLENVKKGCNLLKQYIQLIEDK